MKKFLKWLIPCLVACFMVVGLVQTASFTFATTEEGQTEIVGSSDDLNAGNSNEGSDTDVEGNPEESSEDEPEVDENASDENLEESEIGPEGTVSNARTISLYDSDQNDLTKPAHSKTVSKIEGTNDEYYLSLDVTGRKEIEPGKLPQVDIVLVVDKSGSMDEKINSYEEITYGQLTGENCYAEYEGKKYQIQYDYYSRKWYFQPGMFSRPIEIDENTGFKLFKLNQVTKMTALNNAVTSGNGLSSSILNNTNINARMSVVLFNKTAEQKCDWTNQIDLVNNSIPTGDAGNEGTNYYDALNKAELYLKTAREDSQKYIIFLSDGEPTYYMNGDTVMGTGSDKWWANNLESCKNEAYIRAAQLSKKEIPGFTGFYTVGFGIDTNNNAKNILTNLSNKPDCTKHGSFLANDTASLISVFNSIMAEITENYFSNIKIEDVLSDNVDLTNDMFTDGELDKFTFKVTDSNGVEVKNPGVTPTVKYTSSDKKISIQFPESYQLIDGYTYTVTFKIKPNDNAYDTFAKNKGKYPKESKIENNLEIGGDKDKGFYSNTRATLTYTFKGEEKTVEYSKDQFVEVHPTSLTVKKNWQKSDGSEMKEGLPESIEVELLKDREATGKKITLSKDEWKNTFNYLNPNYSYTVKELSIPGYKVSYSDITNNSITITNTKLPKLTIKKKVTGLFGNKKQTFKVSITLKNADGSALSGKYGEVTFDNDGEAVKEISVDDPIELTDLPFGTSYTVVEDEDSAKGYSVSYQIDDEQSNTSCSGQLEKSSDGDDLVVITNSKDATPLTGITDNTPKGLGLIGSIVVEIAAIAFVLKKKRQLKM